MGGGQTNPFHTSGRGGQRNCGNFHTFFSTLPLTIYKVKVKKSVWEICKRNLSQKKQFIFHSWSWQSVSFAHFYQDFDSLTFAFTQRWLVFSPNYQHLFLDACLKCLHCPLSRNAREATDLKRIIIKQSSSIDAWFWNENVTRHYCSSLWRHIAWA